VVIAASRPVPPGTISPSLPVLYLWDARVRFDEVRVRGALAVEPWTAAAGRNPGL
jgi:hypothetical protein